jgi:hypothetical protein
MGVPVATIRAHVNLRTDFDATVKYLRSFISAIDQEACNVSQVETKVLHGKKSGKLNPQCKSKRNERTRIPTNDKS